MPIPEFDKLGLLPEGVWDCEVGEIEERFCWNDHRKRVWRGCLQFLLIELLPQELPGSLWVDGSFVRAKERPADVDLIVEIEGDDPLILGRALALRLRHEELKREYMVDVWLRHACIPHDIAKFFQYAGDKCAVEIGVDPKHPKGVLRVPL